MPIALDPSQTFPYSLPSDRDKPESERPKFHFRYLTRGDVRRVFELREKAFKTEDDAEAEDCINRALLVGLRGWENIADEDGKPIAFAPTAERLDEVLTATEKWTMSREYPAAATDAEASKKKSYSPLMSNSANSAKDVSAPASV